MELKNFIKTFTVLFRISRGGRHLRPNFENFPHTLEGEGLVKKNSIQFIDQMYDSLTLFPIWNSK